MSKIAFDIGCNVGKYTDILLKEGFDLVVAVDPNPYLFHPTPSKVYRVCKAISDKEQVIPFHFCNADTISTAHKDWTTRSRFANKDYVWKEFAVPATTIDKLVDEFGCPDHIKIDVEGYEEVALKGMTKKYANKICFEWAEEEGDSAVRCVEYLNSLGYTQFGWLLTDPYYEEPTKYMDVESFKKSFEYDKERKETWGMIWAK